MEESRSCPPKEPIKLGKAYTFFMIPFYFEKDEWDDIYSRLGKWQLIKEDLYKEDVLYPYIMGVFNKKIELTYEGYCISFVEWWCQRVGSHRCD